MGKCELNGPLGKAANFASGRIGGLAAPLAGNDPGDTSLKATDKGTHHLIKSGCPGIAKMCKPVYREHRDHEHEHATNMSANAGVSPSGMSPSGTNGRQQKVCPPGGSTWGGIRTVGVSASGFPKRLALEFPPQKRVCPLAISQLVCPLATSSDDLGRPK